MKYIKYLFNFYINSSIHVATSSCALAVITCIHFNLICDKNTIGFIFFATITGYNFVKYFGVAKWHHRKLANWLKIIQVFSLGCFFLMSYYATKLSFKTLFYVAFFGGITFLYAIPFIPERFYMDSQKNLRSISGLKIYIIAIVWAGVTVFIPLLENSVQFNADVYITFLQRYFLVIVLMLPFEIRDLKYDSLKLATLPQKIGIRKTKILGFVLLILLFCMEFFKDQIRQNTIFSLAFLSIILLALLLHAKKEQPYYYSSFLVEGAPLVWLLLMTLLS